MNHPVFSYHLQWAVLGRMTVAAFAQALGHYSPHAARAWVAGDALPPITELFAIAQVLKVDPIEMLAVWTADASAYYEPILKSEVLDPRGSKAKLSTDADIHAFRIDDRMFDRP